MYTPPPKGSSSSASVLIVIALVAVPVLLACAGILLALLLPAVQAAREAARRAACSNNLRQIGVALHNYASANGSFPPAYIADEDGKPMHSWRVLILPYLGEQMLYDQYDLDEPWDGPNNRLLADMMPEVYRCPSSPGEPGDAIASYAMIVGPGAISDGTSKVSPEQIPNMANTIMVAETAGADIHWMEPKDLDIQTMTTIVNGPGAGISSKHAAVANVLYCDGSVRPIVGPVPPGSLQGVPVSAEEDPLPERGLLPEGAVP
ncbi:MAG: DUF1559 domain-containing protein [Pirellulales bacterium]|nr:DUF1559 domain-containing protein [Pirellulales bacterium]